MDLSNYTFQSELGRGGMATVYLAHDNKFDTNVAVKVLSKEFTNNENIRKRFISEARSMFKMSHPNIIKVSDLIEQDGTVAFVMEYIEGETLKEYIERKGKLNDEEIKNLFTQMLEAVGYVHEQNMVHRDIKPSNFMLDKKGRIKLMDFGIAKNMDITSSDYTHTGTNQNMGTPMYMSPEQIKSTKDVTLQSDIYSLGVVLWQMVMGKKPYDNNTSSTFELQMKIVQDELPLTSSFFDEIIQIATHKELNNRFKNCKEFINKLSNVQNQNFDKTLIYADNNSEKTTVVTNIDSTVVESVQNSNTIPKQEINIPNTTSKQNKTSPAVYIIIGIIIIIVLGVMILNDNNNNNNFEQNDSVFDTADVWTETPVEIPSSMISFSNNSSKTVYLAYAFYNNGWETIGWFEILPDSSYDITLPETFYEDSIYWYAEDSNGGKWEGVDGYFCVSHPDAFHFYTNENCNEQKGFYKLDLTGTYTKQNLSD